MPERLKNLLYSIIGRGTWRQVVRMNVSLILSGIVATIIHLDEPVWALITSVIVITQSRLTQTLAPLPHRLLFRLRHASPPAAGTCRTGFLQALKTTHDDSFRATDTKR